MTIKDKDGHEIELGVTTKENGWEKIVTIDAQGFLVYNWKERLVFSGKTEWNLFKIRATISGVSSEGKMLDVQDVEVFQKYISKLGEAYETFLHLQKQDKATPKTPNKPYTLEHAKRRPYED